MGGGSRTQSFSLQVPPAKFEKQAPSKILSTWPNFWSSGQSRDMSLWGTSIKARIRIKHTD